MGVSVLFAHCPSSACEIVAVNLLLHHTNSTKVGTKKKPQHSCGCPSSDTTLDVCDYT
jgi:hypothetical protein